MSARGSQRVERGLFAILIVLGVGALAVVFGYTLAGAVPSSGVLWLALAGVLAALAIVLYLEIRGVDEETIRGVAPDREPRAR